MYGKNLFLVLLFHSYIYCSQKINLWTAHGMLAIFLWDIFTIRIVFFSANWCELYCVYQTHIILSISHKVNGLEYHLIFQHL